MFKHRDNQFFKIANAFHVPAGAFHEVNKSETVCVLKNWLSICCARRGETNE